MKIEITPTEKLISLTNLEREAFPRMVRVWKGKTDTGTECTVLVSGIAVHNSQDQSAFDRELREFVPKVKDRTVYSLREIL